MAVENEQENSRMEALKLENQLCFPLYAASREIVKQYTPYLNEIGLTYTQYIVMMVLWEQKQIGAKQLGELLFLDSGTITPVVKKLEQFGYVKRVRQTEDERAVSIMITGQGEQLRQRAADIPQQIGSCINLEKDEIQTLYRLLYKVLDRFRG